MDSIILFTYSLRMHFLTYRVLTFTLVSLSFSLHIFSLIFLFLKKYKYIRQFTLRFFQGIIGELKITTLKLFQ